MARALSTGRTRRTLALIAALASLAGLTTSAAASCETVVDETRLPGPQQLRTWIEEMEAFGSRPTASPAHESFIDALAQQYTDAGVENVRREPFSVDRWLADAWSLQLTTGAETTTVPSSYIPYSGTTPAGGIAAPLVYAGTADPASWRPGSLAGKIVAVDVPVPDITAAQFYANAYYVHDPGSTMNPGHTYKRTWIGPLLTVARLVSAAKTAGAAGFIGIVDMPADFTSGLYVPFSGEVIGLPALYVDRVAGGAVRAAARQGATADLKLLATRTAATTGNLVGTIPGQSDETIILLSHTDGTNAVWENGPAGILALARYFASVPLECRKRTIQIVLTSGHLTGAKGAAEYIAAHDDDVLDRTVAVLTVEHIGALEWTEGSDGNHHPTGEAEPAAIYASESAALVDAATAMVKREDLGRTFVSHMWFPRTAPRPSPSFPGEGSKFHIAGLPVLNYLTGPTYLLSTVPALDKIDHDLAYRVVRGFAQMIIDLEAVSAEQLRGAGPARRAAHDLGLQ